MRRPVLISARLFLAVWGFAAALFIALIVAGVLNAIIWWFLDHIVLYTQALPSPTKISPLDSDGNPLSGYARIFLSPAGIFGIQSIIAPAALVVISTKRFRGSRNLANWLLIWSFTTMFCTMIGYSDMCARFGIVGGGKESHDPLDCLYFSVVTWTTLGYGDLVPSIKLRAFAAAESLNGYLAMGLLVSAVISWANMGRHADTDIKSKGWFMAELRGYWGWFFLKSNELASPSVGFFMVLAARIFVPFLIVYFLYVWIEPFSIDWRQLLHDLSDRVDMKPPPT